MRILALLLLTGILAAVPSSARAGAVEVDFNPKAEFARYKTWAWIPDRDKGHRGVLMDPIMRGRVEEALSIRLRAVGLVAAAEGQTPDLLVAYRGDTGQGKSGSSNLGGWSSMDNPVYSSVQFTEQTATLMVDLVDAGTKTLAWRLYIDQTFQGANDPPDKLKKVLVKGFEKYPPSASEIAKKARELEKASK